MKILIAEDEKSLSESIVNYLQQEGCICETAFDYRTASAKLEIYAYDCVIVDISLPDGNGLNLIRQIKKKEGQTGVIIISAKNSLDDKVDGLEIGADDYITKPFHLSELNARLKALDRRRNFEGEKEIKINELLLVPDIQTVKINNQRIDLTKKEFDLLLFFISNKNRVLTKDAIAEHLWGDNIDSSDSFDFIYTHIKNLRKKLIERGCTDYIKTIYGMGYKFLIP